MSRGIASLPPELQVWSNLRFIRQRTRYEYSSECPNCGDSGHQGSGQPDRWRMFAQGYQGRDARGFCRQCGHFSWASSDNYEYDPVKAMQIAQERKILLAEQQVRMQRKIDRIAETEFWKGFHTGMESEQRKLWEAEGIPESAQKWWELGYKQDHRFYCDDIEFHSPALVIPYFTPSDDGRSIATIQYRLLNPPEKGDKYRFMAELHAPLFLADAYEKPKGLTLLTEGGKKGMVSWLNLGDKFDTVAAVPSKYPSELQLESLADCDPIVICLDPDGNIPQKDGKTHAERIADRLGRERCSIAHLPEKIDDMIVKYLVDPKDVYAFLRTARAL